MVIIVNDYQVEFEDGQYAVNLVGSNNNIADIAVVNQVQIRSANSAGLTYSDAINAQSFAQEAVHIDTVNGLSGTQFPRGTPSDPVNNIADAYLIATQWNLHRYALFGTITLDQNYDSWGFFAAVSKNTAVVNLAGYDVDDCAFSFIEIAGSGSGEVEVSECRINNVSGIYGQFNHCGLNNAILPANSGKSTFVKCYSEVAGSSIPYIDAGNGIVSNFIVRGFHGGLEVRNIDQPTEKVSVDGDAIRLTIASTCSDGELVIGGGGEITDNSTGTTIKRESFIRNKVTEDRTIITASRSIS